MARGTKIRFSWQADPETQGEQLEANIARNGRFYGFCAICKCDHPKGGWYIKMLIPGGLDFLSECNPVNTLAEAKDNARSIVRQIVADMQGITLID